MKALLKIGFALIALTFAGAVNAASIDSEVDSVESAFIGGGPRDRDSKVTSLNQSAEELTVENEAVDSEIFADTDFIKDANAQAKALTNEIAALERQIARSKSRQEASRKKAELAGKKVELQKQLLAVAKSKFAQTDRQRKERDRKLEALRIRVSSLQYQEAQLKSKNREALGAIRALENENIQLDRKVRNLSNQIAKEKSREKSLRERKARVSKRNDELKARASDLEG